MSGSGNKHLLIPIDACIRIINAFQDETVQFFNLSFGQRLFTSNNFFYVGNGILVVDHF